MRRVVRITSGFQQEAPLNSAAKNLLTQFFDKGWADPQKINHDSRQVAILLNEARESFANSLNVERDEIEFLGEVNLGFHLGISGLLKKNSKFIYSEVDKQSVFAVASFWEKQGGSTQRLQVNQKGLIQTSKNETMDVTCWQIGNGETGILQPAPKTSSQIFADCTSAGVDHLPNFSYDTALFDSRSWQGPAGSALLVIKNKAQWSNPLPHNDHLRNLNSYSVPLVLASAVALEQYLAQKDLVKAFKGTLIDQLRAFNLNFIAVTGDENLDKHLSLIFPGIEADRLVLEMQDLGFVIDSGSACRSADMQPSHVLAALQLPTSGNIRITFHPETKVDQVKELGEAIQKTVVKLLEN